MIKKHDAIYIRPKLGRECFDCGGVPIDPKTRRCTLCDRYYPIYADFDKDRCEHCGSYNVTMNEYMEWYCDDCQQWIESTNEGNGDNYWDCYECGNGFKKEDPGEYEVICYWCR